MVGRLTRGHLSLVSSTYYRNAARKRAPPQHRRVNHVAPLKSDGFGAIGMFAIRPTHPPYGAGAGADDAAGPGAGSGVGAAGLASGFEDGAEGSSKSGRAGRVVVSPPSIWLC